MQRQTRLSMQDQEINTPSEQLEAAMPAATAEAAAPAVEPVEAEPAAASTPEAPRRSMRSVLAAISMAVTVMAWILLMWNGYAALGLGLAAIVLAVAGIRSRSAGWRNLAITSLIASAVLVIVMVAFLIVIYWGLGAIETKA
ncbi:MAG: hypothetical protein ACI30W_03210 [Muribaculaceae bacterium]